MAETVIIDIEARYRDQTADGVKGSTTDMERLRKKMAETEDAGKKANASLEKIASTAASIAKKTISIPVKIIDYATKPLRSLLDYATSLKGILMGLVMGQAGQMLISNPLGLADQYSNAYIGFKTLFNSAERAQQMMDDLDEFARTTPYKTSNVIGQTQKMLAMGWDPNRLIQDMTTIGDAAAATGKGDEGLERIVLALAQIKSKGKLSTEELNQLAEAGINAKAYVAAGMGYGTGDAAQQKLASDLQGGKIGGNAAVEMILAGMQENYAGMMDSISKETVEGIKSNIEDTFEINIFRKWGQGLQEGAKIGLGSLADMLDANQDRLSAFGDKLQEIGAYLSNKLANYAQESIDKAMDIIESEDFSRATIGGKAKMLWDAIIGEPFEQWWDSNGEDLLGNVAGKIGQGLGKFYNGAITTLLGINVDGAAESGVSIGARFAEGFIQGFDAKKVWESIKNGIANALKIVPGGEKADTGSWLSAALLGYGGMKIAGNAKPLLSGIGGLGGSLFGSTKMGELAIMLGSGNLSSTASLGMGVLSALGVGSVAGGALGGVGLISGMADLTRALNRGSGEKEKSVAGWSAASKFGMVGTGAAAGAALGTIIPGVGNIVGGILGAGAGGIAALLAGSKVGEEISNLLDGTGKINAAAAAIQKTGDALSEVSSKASSLEALSTKYHDLTSKIESGALGTDELAGAQADLAQTIEDLRSLYPDLISQYDAENGKLAEKLSLIQEITEEERKQARREAQVAVYEGEKQLPDLEKKIAGTQSNQEAALAEYESLYKKASELADMRTGYNAMVRAYEVYGEDSSQFKELEAANEKRIEEFNKKYDYSITNGVYAEPLYNAIMDEASKALEKAKSEGEQLDELMAKYQEIYQGKMSLALNPESLDNAGGLSAIAAKVEELQAIQQERLELEKQLAELDKGSAEYDATAKAIQDAETRQKELTDAIEPFKEALSDVLDAVKQINEQFFLLGGMRFDLGEMGLSSIQSYLNPQTTSTSGFYNPLLSHEAITKVVGKEAWEAAKNPLSKTPGFASGTLSAPPGLAWVGENGPELVRMRGGERVYNAVDSMRIAEQTSRSSGSMEVIGGIHVDLGGMSISITTGSSGGEDIMTQLRDRLPELSNELCAMIATQLSKSYANMPVNAKGGI